MTSHIRLFFSLSCIDTQFRRKYKNHILKHIFAVARTQRTDGSVMSGMVRRDVREQREHLQVCSLTSAFKIHFVKGLDCLTVLF